MKPVPISTPPTLWNILKYFLYLGSVGFGGPFALIGYMRQDLTENRSWISQSNFMNGLALASLCPGPIATQLAIYIGWYHARIVGATLVLLAFTLPAFLMILMLATLYTQSSDATWAQSVFYGVSASVFAIILRHAFRMSKMIVERDHWLWGIFIANILITCTTKIQVYWAYVICGLIVWIIKAPPRNLSLKNTIFSFGLALGATSNYPIFLKLFLYFSWAGTVVFGSGFAIIPFIHEGVVQNYHWLTERQFLDSLAMGLITPGPVIMSVAFMGYLIAGLKGSIAATVGVFLPCYLCVIILAPHFHRLAAHSAVRSFVQGLTIAVAGSITGTTLLLGKHTITDWPSLGILLGTALAIYKLKRVPEPVWLLVAGCLGMAIKTL